MYYAKTLVRRLSLFRQSSTIRKYVSNTSWLFVEQIIRMGVGLFVGIWIARYLGPETFGLLSYAQSLVGLFGAIATLGLNSIIVRELLSKRIDNDSLLGTAFALKLVGAFAVLAFLFVTVNIIPTDSYTKLIIFIIASSTIFQSFNVIDFFFQAKVLSKYVVYSGFAVMLLSTPLKIFLLVYNAPLEAFALTVVFDNLILAIGLVFFYLKQKQSFRNWKFSQAVAFRLLKDSWPLILSSISISIAMRIDQVMLKSLANQSSVGFYAVGVKMAEVFNFIPMIISQSIFPKIIEMDFGKERNKLIYLIRYIFYLMVILAVLVNFLSYFTISILYGQDYLASVGVLDILIWSIPITYLNIITSTILLKLNRNIIILFKQLLLAVINIVLNIILIPKFGIIGAAGATLTADFFILFFELFSRRDRWIFFLRIQAILYIPVKHKHY